LLIERRFIFCGMFETTSHLVVVVKDKKAMELLSSIVW